MCCVLGCQEAALPVKYLGVPLGANPRLVKTWKPIIDKVEEKLSLWKAKILNKAGKLVLIKSVLNSLPVYYLSLYKMPKAVAEKLISLQRRFLWSKEDGRNGMALVRWEVVQAPKKFGGLGVGDAMLRNTALLFKWWWRFSKEDCPLWKKVVCACNNLNPDVLLSSQILPIKGGPWKDICQIQFTSQQIRQKIITGLAMEVGDGRGTRFWEDVWLRGGALKVQFPRLFSVSNQRGSFIGDCGFWDGAEWIWNFQWRRELFQWELDLVNQLHDALRLVKLAHGNPGGQPSRGYNKLQLYKDNLERFSSTKGGTVCLVWCAWLAFVGRQWSCPGTLKEHFITWTEMSASKEERKRWLMGFCAIIWNIWLERNRRIFQNKGKGVAEVIHMSVMNYKEWLGGDPFCC
ncbi:uncharacterized protein [Arachis hypogaea]|uniref:uncharacterized protein n=1 Tax=Arachis hypogaea TaxID=3818 RepID=UPI003B2174A9